MIDFVGWPKMTRLTRECIITEKIDGTNAQVHITEDGEIYAGSRKRWITPEDDNFGFAAWVEENKEELMWLGPGSHFGEWWGRGIQRKYDQEERHFSLFNAKKWAEIVPVHTVHCCEVVPVLYRGDFCTHMVDGYLEDLANGGSKAAPGFMKPEGVVVYHVPSNTMFKKTLEGDGGKWRAE